MWRKIISEIKYHHLVPIFTLLSLIFVTAGIFLYWQEPNFGKSAILFLLLAATFLWGILLVISTHVAHRDGFSNGYHNGYADGEHDGFKKSS